MKSGRAGALLILVLTFAAYLPALQAGFIWDDDFYVTDNRALRTPGGLARIWADSGATPQYYPLTHTTFWIEYRLWGDDPAGYHAVNVALHAGAAIVLFLLLRFLGVPGALLAAALFAAHPVHVESVAWVTERKNVLSGLLYVSSLACWSRYLGLGAETEDDDGPAWAVAGALLFVGALLSKTVTSSLPVTLALLVWWRGRRFTLHHGLLLGPMLIAGALMGSLTSFLEKSQVGAEGAEWSLGWMERTILAGRAWWFYLQKLVLPVDQAFIYPRWDVEGAGLAWLAWPTLAAAVLLALWLARKRIGRGPFAAMAYYSVALLPAMGFFNVYPMRYSFVADHFVYLASLGPIVLLAALVVRGAERVPRRQVVTPVLVLVVLVLGALTWKRCQAFQNPESLWRDTVAANPEAWMAHNNLGALELRRGNLDAAEWSLRRAVELKPDHVGALSNLGVVYLRANRPADAVPVLREAIALDPEHVNALINLGEAELAGGNPAGAEDAWVRAMRIEPSSTLANRRLGSLYLEAGRFEESERRFRTVLRRAPRDADARVLLGVALAQQGRNDESFSEFETALAVAPDHARAHFNMGTLLARLDRLEEAESHLAEAVRLDPGNEAARRSLALVRELLQKKRGTDPKPVPLSR